jgi:O-succinylbenzoate synthase
MEGEGHYAWGETCTVYEPSYSREHTLGVFHTVREHFVPRIIGQDIESAQDLLDHLAIFKGNEFAKACLEVPWWVLDAKRKGVPLHRLLGGKRDRVAVGADFGVQDSLDALLSKIQGAIDDGYCRVKLKFRPGWDINMLDAVRSTFPEFSFHIDCNAAYTLADADLFQKVDRYRLAMIEQPLQDDGLSLYHHAELQEMIETPICLDESIHNLIDAQLAIRLKSCRIVNIKVARVGGLSASLAIHDLCAEHGIPCWIGSMLESGIGGGINIELATLPNFTYPADIFPSQMFFRREIATPEVVLSGPAEMAASQVPGIPYEPVPELLGEYAVQHVSFEA